MSKFAQALEKVQSQHKRSEHQAVETPEASVFVPAVNARLGHDTPWESFRDFLSRARYAIFSASAVIGVFIFLFGVQQGMKIEKTISQASRQTDSKSGPFLDGLTVTVVDRDPEPEPAAAISQPPAEVPVSAPSPAGLTYQLISYANAGRAEQEVQKLRSKGYEAFAVRLGRYSLVCLERFASREQGVALRRRLEKDGLARIYPDAFVRNVPRS